jgi:sulfopyruvate decarboxylase TPP-binding subunit
MVNFLHYGVKRHVAVKPTVKKAVAEKKEEEMTAQVVMAESTAKVLENEQIEIQEVDTVQEVVEKVNKSKKVRAKKEKDGNVRVKQVLKD